MAGRPKPLRHTGHPRPFRRTALRPLRTCCTNARTGRNLTLRPRTEHDILRRARVEQDTDHWRRRYGHRAGVEGTISQGVQAFGLRRSRYRGLAKTRLQHHLTGAAINLARLDAWHTGRPLARTRVSPLRGTPPRWMRSSGAELTNSIRHAGRGPSRCGSSPAP
ncbi:hypothetical protein GCM10022243_02920 [Saccharothrix violaceirubra]|uniref:transposase n=1 Tax=Saccharothrix violaceirubra TaxID=413306 RepID=UPI001C876E68|nr:transposase [Saccharothrix violaceirubra]